MEKQINFVNAITLIALLLSFSTNLVICNDISSKIGEPIQIELDIPDEYEKDFENFSDLIDFEEVILKIMI
jgi:hypothetical protein